MREGSAEADGKRRRPGWLVLLVGLLVVVTVAGVVALAARDGSPDRGTADPVASATPSAPAASVAPSRSDGSTTPTPSGSSSTAPPPQPRPPRRAGLTVGAALYAMSDARLARAMADLRSLGMHWIRIDVSWAAVQPVSRIAFRWAEVDRVVSAARAERIDVLALLSYTPSWARRPGCRSFACPPRRAADFAAFAARVVARYEPRGVRTYQVWNEPNIDKFWTSPDPAAYGRLLEATVRAMRGVSSRLRVILGGLAFVGDPTRDNVDAAAFVRRACAGGRCRVDAVGYDPYTYPRRPGSRDVPLNAWQLIANPAAGDRQLRRALAAVGLGRTPIWITAFGAPTATGAASGRLVSEATQARILVDGARLAGASPATIGAYFVDTYRDIPALGTVAGHFGLLRSDGSRKPAFAALRAVLR